ncbi:hypothetical protein D3C76_1741740 [compost metagenome]
MGFQAFGRFYVLHFAGEQLFHRRKQLFVILFGLGIRIGRIGFDTQIAAGYRLKFFILVVHDDLDGEFIDVIG